MNTEEAVKKISLTIDDKKVEVTPDKTVFQAAMEAGIFVPHYCYHPDLSIAGVCRMCLVEVDNAPKLQISCNTPVRDGMVVRTSSDKARQAQKGSLELHLINHPVDCPICDKAGECKLQDFYREFGLYKSRVELSDKVHKPKAKDIGTIVLDAERCILCTRCTRFTHEVTHTDELVIVNRGDRSELKTYDDGPLRNDYTGNLADICPVGALTARDFRFQQRVWFLEEKDSVCTMCARGCNTKVSYNPKTKQLYRVEPRRNPDVNKSWICDTGRWRYHYVYAESRLRTPEKISDGKVLESTWHQAFGEMKRALDDPSGVVIGLSTQLTNEEILELVLSFKEAGVKHFVRIVDEQVVDERTPWDGVLKHRDHTANAEGFARMFAMMNTQFLDFAAYAALVAEGNLRHAWFFGLEGEEVSWASRFVEALPEGVSLTLHATSRLPIWERAQWLLPAASAFEKSGTLVNALGRLQRLQSAIPRFSLARDAHAVAFGIVRGSDRDQAPEARHIDLFEKLIATPLVGRELAWKKLDPMGIALKERS